VTDPNSNELVGRLTLADAMLGEVVTDLLRILGHANWPGTVSDPYVGWTTSRAAKELQKGLTREAAFASPALVRWIADVQEVVERRDRVIHAIALNQCMSCGDATMFRHPRSGDDVDRSPSGVAAVVQRYDHLRADGLPLAQELSAAVNQRIYIEARKMANATDEIQAPPQIYPRHVEHLCAACTGGRGSTVVHVGTAIAVIPDARWPEFRDGRWPPDESD